MTVGFGGGKRVKVQATTVGQSEAMPTPPQEARIGCSRHSRSSTRTASRWQTGAVGGHHSQSVGVSKFCRLPSILRTTLAIPTPTVRDIFASIRTTRVAGGKGEESRSHPVLTSCETLHRSRYVKKPVLQSYPCGVLFLANLTRRR